MVSDSASESANIRTDEDEDPKLPAVLNLLREGRGWVKNRAFGVGEDGEQRCLSAAINACKIHEKEHVAVRRAIERRFYDRAQDPACAHRVSIVRFNDHKETVWSDVRLVITLAMADTA